MKEDMPYSGGAPNKALHLTPVNVAKIRDYSHLFRVVERGAVVVGRR